MHGQPSLSGTETATLVGAYSLPAQKMCVVLATEFTEVTEACNADQLQQNAPFSGLTGTTSPLTRRYTVLTRSTGVDVFDAPDPISALFL